MNEVASTRRIDGRRGTSLGRCQLFRPDAHRHALRAASECGDNVLSQEPEAFAPPERRREARAVAAEIDAAGRAAGSVEAVRVNPLDAEDHDHLAEVMRGCP